MSILLAILASWEDAHRLDRPSVHLPGKCQALTTGASTPGKEVRRSYGTDQVPPDPCWAEARAEAGARTSASALDPKAYSSALPVTPIDR